MNKIYLIDTNVFNNKDIYDYWYNIMSDDRKKKIDKCLYDKDKRLLLGAGVLLYRGLKVLDINDIELILQGFKRTGRTRSLVITK